VFGHEVVGEVVEVGAAMTAFSPGVRVVVAHHVPCFACHSCRRGSPSMCRHFKLTNLDPGGFAEVCRVPAPNVAHASPSRTASSTRRSSRPRTGAASTS
jgi:L-iditol 2-dehydrogenase